mgnify:CR=1 FL=1
MDDAAPATTAIRPSPPRLSPSTAILLAVWVGLVAGYLDLGAITLKRFAINKEGSYRTARDFPWTVPTGHVVLALAPAAALAFVSWRRPRWVPLRAASMLLATLAFWAALARLPIYTLAGLALAFGGGKLFSDVVSAFGFGLRMKWTRVSLAGLLGILLVLFAASTGWRTLGEARAVAALPSPPSASPRNVLLIVWDTVRASNLSLYGYHRPTTPNLTRWAEKGTVFGKALTPAPWTYPAHSSFFTGHWPYTINSQWKYALDAPVPTLAEFLTMRGYQTAGFAANTNCCNYETRLDRGFIHYDDYALTPRSLLSRTVPGKWLLEQLLIHIDPYERKWVEIQSRGAAAINDSFLGWLGRRRPDRPFFAFLNYYDAHDPYIAPAGSAGRLGARPVETRDYQALIDFIGADKDALSTRDMHLIYDGYDDCIAHLDDQLGRLLDELERRRILDDTVVIITSDHGEAFGEHTLVGHAHAVEIQEVGVPLVILAPGEPTGRSVPTAVTLRDLPATVTDLLGLSEGSPFPGRSLAEYWRTSPGQAAARLASTAFSEKVDETVLQTPRGDSVVQMSVVAPYGVQYIRTSDGTEGLFNLWRDPMGMTDVLGTPEGNALLQPSRKLLLEVLEQDAGTVEVEAAYLKAFRRDLAETVKRGDAEKLSARDR